MAAAQREQANLTESVEDAVRRLDISGSPVQMPSGVLSASDPQGKSKFSMNSLVKQRSREDSADVRVSPEKVQDQTRVVTREQQKEADLKRLKAFEVLLEDKLQAREREWQARADADRQALEQQWLVERQALVQRWQARADADRQALEQQWQVERQGLEQRWQARLAADRQAHDRVSTRFGQLLCVSDSNIATLYTASHICTRARTHCSETVNVDEEALWDGWPAMSPDEQDIADKVFRELYTQKHITDKAAENADENSIVHPKVMGYLHTILHVARRHGNRMLQPHKFFHEYEAEQNSRKRPDFIFTQGFEQVHADSNTLWFLEVKKEAANPDTTLREGLAQCIQRVCARYHNCVPKPAFGMVVVCTSSLMFVARLNHTSVEDLIQNPAALVWPLVRSEVVPLWKEDEVSDGISFLVRLMCNNSRKAFGLSAVVPEPKGFTYLGLLGSGGFADVHRVEFESKVYAYKFARSKTAVTYLPVTSRTATGSPGRAAASLEKSSIQHEINILKHVSELGITLGVPQCHLDVSSSSSLEGFLMTPLGISLEDYLQIVPEIISSPDIIAFGLHVVSTVANILQSVHLRDIIHLDIRPSNILMVSLDDPTQTSHDHFHDLPWARTTAYLADWGLAQSLPSTTPNSPLLVKDAAYGYAPFMSDDQVRFRMSEQAFVVSREDKDVYGRGWPLCPFLDWDSLLFTFVAIVFGTRSRLPWDYHHEDLGHMLMQRTQWLKDHRNVLTGLLKPIVPKVLDYFERPAAVRAPSTPPAGREASTGGPATQPASPRAKPPVFQQTASSPASIIAGKPM